MKSEVRRFDFDAFRFCSFRKKSELSSSKQHTQNPIKKKTNQKKREILNTDL